MSKLFSEAPGAMALRSVVVIRGMSKPPLGFMVAASMSSIALELGTAPVELMPMFWAEHKPAPPIKNPPPTPKLLKIHYI